MRKRKVGNRRMPNMKLHVMTVTVGAVNDVFTVTEDKYTINLIT